MRTIPRVQPSAPTNAAPVTRQTFLTATVTSDGAGGYRIVPGKPVHEIPSREVAKLLGMSRGNLSLVVNSPLGQKHLRWRWLTERKGKRVFELASVAAYRDALKDLE